MVSSTPAVVSKKCKDQNKQSQTTDLNNEPSQEQQSVAQRVLAEAIRQEKLGLEALPAARFQLLKAFGRIERLGGQIDEAFGGQPFLRNLPPDSPANWRRFNAFFEYHRKVTGLLGKAIELWMFACGLKMEDDWVPLLIAQMNQNAARSRPSQSEGAVMDRLRAILASDRPNLG